MSLRSIPHGFRRRWILRTNDEQVNNVHSADLSQWGFGSYRYGLAGTPVIGYDAVVYREFFLGGTVIVAHSIEPVTQEVLVAILLQNRPNQGGVVLSLPRGFVVKASKLKAFLQRLKAKADHAGRTLTLQEVWAALHALTGFAELTEEMVQTPVLNVDKLQMLGRPINTNNALVDTVSMDKAEIAFLQEIFGWSDKEVKQMSPDVIGGVYFMSIEIPFELLIQGKKPGSYLLKKDVRAQQGILEGILRCEFHPLATVLKQLDDPTNPQAGDGFTEIGISRLDRSLRTRR